MKRSMLMAVAILGPVMGLTQVYAAPFISIAQPSASEYSDKYMSRSMQLFKDEQGEKNHKKQVASRMMEKPSKPKPYSTPGKTCSEVNSEIAHPGQQISPEGEAPVCHPTHAQIHLPTWKIKTSLTMEKNLRLWAKEAHYKLLWRAQNWVPNQKATFKGSFRTAINHFVNAVGSQGGNIRAGFYSNHVLIITGSGVKQ